jgi:hypothetical protein
VDAGTQSNGYADSANRRLHLYLYPPSDPDLGFAPSWWSLVGGHEYAHWLHLTSATGLPGILAWAFGDAWAPGVFGPAWLAEGLAVYAESAGGPFQGRLNSGLYDAYLDARLRAGRPPGLAQALFVPPAFPGLESPYLFGGQFVEYLARAYGQEAVTRFLQDQAGSALSYLSPLLPLVGVDRSARRVFGKRTTVLWRDWLEDDPAYSPAEAETPASQTAWWMGTPVPHEGRVYFLRSLPYPAGPFRQSWRRELRELGPEGERTLARFASAFSADLKWREGRLYFGLRELERGLANVEMLGFGDGTVLYALDPAGGRRELVLRAPLRAYEVLPGGDVVYSRDRPGDFGSEILLWKRRPAAGEENPRLLAASDYLVREILAREGRLFVSARRHGENFGVYEVDPLTFRLSPILPGPYGAGGLDFTGGQLRFVANYGGRFAVYAWDPEAAGRARLTSAQYAVSPALDPVTGLLWYVGLNPEGYALYNVRPRPTAVEAPEEAAPVSVVPVPPAAAEAPEGAADMPTAAEAPEGVASLPSGSVLRAGGYGPNLATLAPRLLLPVLTADAAGAGYLGGATVLGRSALGDLAYSITGLVDLATGAPAAEGSLELLTPPLAWSLAASTRRDGWLGASVQVPVFRRLAPLACSLDFGLAGHVYDGQRFPGRALQPYLEYGLGWPLDALEGRAALWLERIEWGASENQARLEGDLVFEHFFRCGALRAALEGFQRLDGGESALAPLRGNFTELMGRSAAAVNLDFFLRLLQIRAGTWNPPFYMQDVYLVPFAGAAMTEMGQLQTAAGLELHWEMKTLAVWTGLPLEFTAGLAVNGEGDPSLYFNLKSPLKGLPLAGLEPGRIR